MPIAGRRCQAGLPRLVVVATLLLACLLAAAAMTTHVDESVLSSAPPKDAVRDSDDGHTDCEESTSSLLAWGVEVGVIAADQRLRLLHECQRRATEAASKTGMVREVLTAVGSRFTLSNVLYFFGGLLVIGAMTLFMTLGWESFGGKGIFIIATMYGAIFAMMGRYFWNPAGDEGWNTVGGILYTIAISMTPLAVYGLERATGIWPSNNPGVYSDYFKYVKASWLPMEAATCFMACLTLYFVRFPFLTMPIAFSLWLMSMDLVPVIYSKMTWDWNDRAKVSMYFGAIVLAAAFYVDQWLSSSGDFAFWFYLSGLITFWGGLTSQESKHEAGGVVYMAINAALIIFAQKYDRMTFALFGLLGICVYTYVTVTQAKMKYAMLLYLRGILGLILLLAAHKWESSIALWAALVSIGSFNYLMGLRGMNDFELLLIVRLIINVGLYEGSSVFASQRVSLLLFDIPAHLPVALVAGLSTLAFHIPFATDGGKIFCSYRLLLCYAFVGASVYYPGLLYLGVLGIAGFFIKRTAALSKNLQNTILFYSLAISLMVISEMFNSRIVYWLGLAICVWALVMILDYRCSRQPSRHGALLCIMDMTVILISILIESQTLIIMGGLSIFVYLGYLAQNVFRNSLLFPFALTGMGLGILFAGIQYQKHQELIRGALLSLLPHSLATSQLLNLGELNYGLPTWAQQLIWLPQLVNLVESMPDYTLFLAILCTVVMVVLFFAIDSFFSLPLTYSTDLNIRSCVAIWPQDTENHGLTLEVSGTKDADLTVSQAYLYMDSPEVWSLFERKIGHTPVTAFKYAFHPLKLCPTYMDPAAFEKGKTTFRAVIHLGTGHNGTQRVSHATLRSHLSQLQYWSDPAICLQIVQRSGFLGRRRKLLFDIPLRASRLINALDSNRRAVIQ